MQYVNQPTCPPARRPTPYLQTNRHASALSLAAALALGATLAAPATAATYRIDFDTRSIAGASGSLDFQWNLGGVDPALFASVSDFSAVPASASRAAPILLFGDVTGSLAGGSGLSFAGSQPFNYIYQPLTFGAQIGFTLTLPDTAPVQANGGSFASAFVVSLFDAALNPALPSSSSDGAALVFTLAPGAGPALERFTPATVLVVPEPATWALSVAGLVAIAMAYRRRARPASVA